MFLSSCIQNWYNIGKQENTNKGGKRMVETTIIVMLRVTVNVDWETLANMVKIVSSILTTVYTYHKIKNIKNSHDRDNRNHD